MLVHIAQWENSVPSLRFWMRENKRQKRNATATNTRCSGHICGCFTSSHAVRMHQGIQATSRIEDWRVRLAAATVPVVNIAWDRRTNCRLARVVGDTSDDFFTPSRLCQLVLVKPARTVGRRTASLGGGDSYCYLWRGDISAISWSSFSVCTQMRSSKLWRAVYI